MQRSIFRLYNQLQNTTIQNNINYAFAKMSVREGINAAISEEIERDPDVFLMGEEVAKYNGAYKISKGLYDKYGEHQVIDTPITENGFTGIGVGAAMYGCKPIIEFMTWNFALQAIDHIVNSSSKLHYMSNGELSTQITFRGLNGASAAVAAQHSQCFASWYSSIPGLITIAPYDTEDARGLLKAAIRDPNPVVFLENEIMYGEVFEVSDKVIGKDFVLPIGKAKIMREGKDVTIVAFSRPVKYAIEVADILAKEGVEVEVINLRTIRPLDRAAIIKSVKKTNRLVVIEEGWPQSGVGSEICALMMESSAFDYLDAPVERVTGLDIPMPYAANLEALCLPNVNNLLSATKRALGNKK